MDKTKGFAAPTKPVRPTSKRVPAEVPSTSKKVVPKEKLFARKSMAPIPISRSRPNTTVLDETVWGAEASTDLDSVHAELAYGKFLRNMLEECLVEEKIEREETQMDVQMVQLADRFKQTMDQLDKTNRRLKEISFVAEQKRLLDLKNQDCANFYNITENSSVKENITNLVETETAVLDNLETVNVDFGYNNESGHKQLLDAVNEAIEGLESIKKNSKLDSAKFEEYKHLNKKLDKMEKDSFDIDKLKKEFEEKFPKYSEKLLKDISDKVSSIIDNDDDEDS